MWKTGENGEKNYSMSEFADADMMGQSLKDMIAQFEQLATRSNTVGPAVRNCAAGPPAVAQADEIIDGPVLTDILERLRRLEKAVAELLVKENHRILTP